MGFPVHRMRRLRRNENLRRLVRETELNINDLVYPLFVRHGSNFKKEIVSMPGVYQMSADLIARECAGVFSLGIPAVMLFGIPGKKDETGSEALNPGGVIQTALQYIKKEVPELLLIADLCLCEYTSHGHCGIIKNGDVDNDETLRVLSNAALSFAESGADIIAPSDMMDGRVKAVRDILDRINFSHIPVMSYSAKYSSSFYGPFRDAAESAPSFGDRKSYQMDPANSREALREIDLDIEEGADIIIIKPALAYLDIIAKARGRFDIPIAAFNVSGEYSMIKAAGAANWLDEKKVMLEMLISIKRAGADIIITYFAKEAAALLRQR